MPRLLRTRCWLFCLILLSHAPVAESVAAPSTQPQAGDIGKAILPPPPADAAVEKARHAILEIYSREYRETTVANYRNLATKLTNEGLAVTNDLAGRYAMLREARDVALSAGDLQRAIAAIDALGQSFAIDANSMRVDAIIAINGAAAVTDNTATVETGLRVLDVLLDDDQDALALKLAKAIHVAAARSRKAPLISAAKSALARVQLAIDESEKIKPAFEKLKADPADPAANSAVGKFLCFREQDWKAGLLALSKGSDAQLRNPAQLDLATPTQAPACKAIADGWWDLASGSQGRMQAVLRARAALWYLRGIDQGLQGLERALAEHRIAEAGPIPPKMAAGFPPAPAPPVAAGPTPATQPAASTGAPTTPVATIPVLQPDMLDAMRKNSARVTATHYQPRDLKQRQDVSREWEKIPSIFQRFPAVIYDQQSEKDVWGFVEFEVTRSGYLFLAVCYKYQGNESGNWTQTRLTKEDFLKQGWQPVDKAALGGSLVLFQSKNDRREQLILVKEVKTGEKYNLRCNKHDPPFVILFK